jgi:hypothetical protein
MKLLAGKLAAGKSTPIQDKMGTKSSTPVASDGKPTSLSKDNQTPATRSPSIQKIAIADTSKAMPDRSAIISAKLHETKLSPKADGQANGVAGREPSRQISNGVPTVNGNSPSSHRPMQSLDRKDSSKAIDDLVAEYSAGFPGPIIPNSETPATTETLRTSTCEPAVTRVATTNQNTGDLAIQQPAPISSGTSEQGEIHEEPPIPKAPAPKTSQVPTKPSGKPSNNKANATQRSQKMPPKKLIRCDICTKDFGHEDDLARHKTDVHPTPRSAERNGPKADNRREDYGRTDPRRPREDMSRPEPPSRPREIRRYSDDRYDRAAASRYEPYPPRERHQDIGKSRQPNSIQLARHDSTTMKDPVQPLRGTSATEKNLLPKPQASTQDVSTKPVARLGHTAKEIEEWLDLTGFYRYDEAQRKTKLTRWRRKRELSEERERLELEEEKEKEAEEKARSQARTRARTSAARATSTLSVDLAEALSDAVPSPELTREVPAPAMQSQVVPALPNDDIGLRIKDSARRSTETSPMQPTFAPQNPLNTSALSTPSLKRRFPTNDQPPNGRAEKLPRLETDNRSSDIVLDEPVSATRTQPTGGTDDPHSAHSRDISTHGPDRGRFRSRSPVQRRDSDYQILIYDDLPEERPPFRSRDVSPLRNRYDAYRPDSPAIEGAYDRQFEDRPRGGDYPRRGEYQPYGYGRGGDSGRGGRGGYRGYAQRGNYRGGRGSSIERDGGRYRR